MRGFDRGLPVAADRQLGQPVAFGELGGVGGDGHQQLGDAVLPVDIHAADGQPIRVGMRQHPPVFGTVLADLDRLAAALGLPPDALGTHPDLPAAQVVGTGADHLMTGVTGRAAVDAARPDQSALAELLRPAGGAGARPGPAHPTSGSPSRTSCRP